MVKHNNVIPNGHFKKHWQNYVKTWFNQPARKERRRIGGYRNFSHLGFPYFGPELLHFLLFIHTNMIFLPIWGQIILTDQYVKSFLARQKKAVKIFPRPTTGKLRPIVHGQTLKYNMKVRSGRGFSLEELKVGGFYVILVLLLKFSFQFADLWILCIFTTCLYGRKVIVLY